MFILEKNNIYTCILPLNRYCTCIYQVNAETVLNNFVLIILFDQHRTRWIDKYHFPDIITSLKLRYHEIILSECKNTLKPIVMGQSIIMPVTLSHWTSQYFQASFPCQMHTNVIECYPMYCSLTFIMFI